MVRGFRGGCMLAEIILASFSLRRRRGGRGGVREGGGGANLSTVSMAKRLSISSNFLTLLL